MAKSAWLKEQWVDRMTQAMILQHPDIEEKVLRKLVTEEFDKSYRDHDAVIYNSYEEIVYNTTLGETVDWINQSKPILAESGVFFYPKDQKRNVNTEIIKECMLDIRTTHKKEKFAALDAGDMFLASVKDIQQSNDKKAANSGYGAEGQQSSFLYNMNAAMSVTASGRGQLSTATQTIENFLADYVKFWNMDEFYNFMYNIIHEQGEWKFDTFKTITNIPTKEQWVKRFKNKFLHQSLMDSDKICAAYDSMSDELRVRTYYKCNIYEFLTNWRPKVLLTRLMATPVVYKKDSSQKHFIDPNSIPDSWEEPLHIISDMVYEFVGYKYGQFRYEDRTKYMKKAVTPVSDTDS